MLFIIRRHEEIGKTVYEAEDEAGPENAPEVHGDAWEEIDGEGEHADVDEDGGDAHGENGEREGEGGGEGLDDGVDESEDDTGEHEEGDVGVAFGVAKKRDAEPHAKNRDDGAEEKDEDLAFNHNLYYSTLAA